MAAVMTPQKPSPETSLKNVATPGVDSPDSVILDAMDEDGSGLVNLARKGFSFLQSHVMMW